MDQTRLKEIFEEKYQKLLGYSFEEWLKNAPQNEIEAYAKLQSIDEELKTTQTQFEESTGNGKWELGEYREKLRNEYQFLEELFNLESQDE